MLLYRIVISCFAALVLGRTLLSSGLEDARQRLGLGRGTKSPTLWLHGASNGELASARPLLDQLLESDPDLQVLITCNSVSGRAYANQLAPGRVTAVLAPLDLGWITRAFVQRWSVTKHVTLESEFWPNRLITLAAHGTPIVAIGARLSEASARSWARLPAAMGRALSSVSLLSPQDGTSGQRFLDLGLPKHALVGIVDLKAFYEPKNDALTEQGTESLFYRSHTWLASSTHEGEDQIVLQAHLQAKQKEPELRLILAPRHPARGDDLANLIAQHGLTFHRRSTGATFDPDTDVLLADSLGEMEQWYAKAGRVFVGGSLVDKGGHTPYEPAFFCCALLHGPYVRNFAGAYARLAEAQSATQVARAEELAKALGQLSQPAHQEAAGQSAKAALRPEHDLNWLAQAVLKQA